MAVIDSGSDTANKMNVNTAFQGSVCTPLDEGQAIGIGYVSFSSNVDPGDATGVNYQLSPETDTDYRLRVGQDQMLDEELFTYTAQNTGKHSFAFTTLTATVSANGLLLNSGGITTASTGCTFGTFAMFPLNGTAPLHAEMSMSFSAQPTSNVVVDFGAFQRGAATAFAPLDGCYFRLTSNGLEGIVNNNGTETSTGVFPLANGSGTFVYTNNAVNRYLIQISNVNVTFWINNVLVGKIANPVAQSQPFRSAAVPLSVRFAISAGGAGSVLQASLWDYRVGFRGPAVAEQFGLIGNRMYGSYQGLSGNTMGSLAGYTNNLAPTAGVLPTNTTAALGTGLGGQFQELYTLALNTDGIISSFQNPAGSTTVQGRRLRIHGVRIEAFVSTVLAGGPANAIWTLNFGHTAASLATAESASFATGTAKAPRRIVLGQQAMVVTAPVNTAFSPIDVKFTEAIYVNPGEFVAVAKKYYGTVGTAGVIQNLITIDYGWE